MVADDAAGLTDPHPGRTAFQHGGPGDVADREPTGPEIALQCGDAVELDLPRADVDLAVTENAFGQHLGPRRVQDQPGPGRQLDRDGDRTVLIARLGRLDGQDTVREVDLGLLGDLDVLGVRAVGGLDPHDGVGPVGRGDPDTGACGGQRGGDRVRRGERGHVVSPSLAFVVVATTFATRSDTRPSWP